MGEAILKIKTNQLIDVLRTLPSNDRNKILRFLEDLTWGKRFDDLVKHLKKKTKKITMKEIACEVETVRKELYESRSRH